MPDLLDRLKTALADRYAIEREIGRLSVHTLRLDPRWDPIREHPSFQALLAKYEN